MWDYSTSYTSQEVYKRNNKKIIMIVYYLSARVRIFFLNLSIFIWITLIEREKGGERLID